MGHVLGPYIILLLVCSAVHGTSEVLHLFKSHQTDQRDQRPARSAKTQKIPLRPDPADWEVMREDPAG